MSCPPLPPGIMLTDENGNPIDKTDTQRTIVDDYSLRYQDPLSVPQSQGDGSTTASDHYLRPVEPPAGISYDYHSISPYLYPTNSRSENSGQYSVLPEPSTNQGTFRFNPDVGSSHSNLDEMESITTNFARLRTTGTINSRDPNTTLRAANTSKRRKPPGDERTGVKKHRKTNSLSKPRLSRDMSRSNSRSRSQSFNNATSGYSVHATDATGDSESAAPQGDDGSYDVLDASGGMNLDQEMNLDKEY